MVADASRMNVDGFLDNMDSHAKTSSSKSSPKYICRKEIKKYSEKIDSEWFV